MAEQVFVKFPLDQDTWNKMVVDAEVSHEDVIERSDHFIITYQSRDDYESEIARVEGMVEHQQVTDPDKDV
jgi:hypothetical protein